MSSTITKKLCLLWVFAFFTTVTCSSSNNKTGSETFKPTANFSTVTIDSLGKRRVLNNGKYNLLGIKAKKINIDFTNGNLQPNAGFDKNALKLLISNSDNNYNYNSDQSSIRRVTLNRDDNNSIIYHFEQRSPSSNNLKTSFRIFIPSGYKYIYYASQNLLGALEKNLDTYGRFYHGGMSSTRSTLTGSATYNSKITINHYVPRSSSQNYKQGRFATYRGTGTIDADFTTGAIIGSFGNLTSDTTSRNGKAPTTVVLAALLNGANFNGRLNFRYFEKELTFSANSLNGNFYGPNAEEVAVIGVAKVASNAPNYANEEFISLIIGKKK